MADFEKKDTSLLYVQVADYVREKIYSKEWGVDERIPSEHELMAMLHLSRGTVQKGIRSLVEEGLLVQQRGRGTFVIQPVMARPSGNKLHSFAESMNEQGIEYVTRVVEKRIDRANRVCAQNLGIAEGSTFLYLMRVRSVAEQPSCSSRAALTLSRALVSRTSTLSARVCSMPSSARVASPLGMRR